MTPEIAYQDDHVTLWCGDMRDVLPLLDMRIDAAVVDPPYAQTALDWDRWIDGWPKIVAGCTDSMWSCGTLRMFLDHAGEFAAAGWRLNDELAGRDDNLDHLLWAKNSGTRPTPAGAFTRVHEFATHWYRGKLADIHRDAPRVPSGRPPDNWVRTATGRGQHVGQHAVVSYVDDGTRIMRSVIPARIVRGGISRTQKPCALIEAMIRHAVPPGGVVLDPTAGSCTTGVVARRLGRRALLVEADPDQCAQAATRLAELDTAPPPPITGRVLLREDGHCRTVTTHRSAPATDTEGA